MTSVIVLPRHAHDLASPPPGIFQVPPHFDRIVYALHALWSAFRYRVDVVFCGHLYMAPLAALVAKLKGAKLIIQAHGIEAWPMPTALQRTAVEAADLVLCVSRYTRARVLGWAAIVPERVLVIPNMVGERFSPGDGKALRKLLNLESERMFLTVGRMDARERYKGHDRVIAALPSLVAAGIDVVYLIAGDGTDRVRLETIARELEIHSRVRFLGVVGPEDLVATYRAANLFVMPSTREGFGIAFLEATACGTPALGLNVAGARDALADGELGTLTSESELLQALKDSVEAPMSEPGALSAKVHARFGRQAFAAWIDAICTRLQEAA